jgi:hypothetical protein
MNLSVASQYLDLLSLHATIVTVPLVPFVELTIGKNVALPKAPQPKFICFQTTQQQLPNLIHAINPFKLAKSCFQLSLAIPSGVHLPTTPGP